MNFDIIVEEYMTSLLTEGRHEIVAIYPGGFKPPHKGHYELVKAYASDPNIFEVKILLGPKERTDESGKLVFTEQQSRDIWQQYYIPTLPGNVKIEDAPHPVPVRAAYDYVGTVAEDGEWVTLMSSVKDVDDAKRAREFAEKHNPQTGKYHRDSVTVAYYPKDTVAIYSNRLDGLNGKPVSASQMREDIAASDFENFKTNLPDEVQGSATDILNVITSSL